MLERFDELKKLLYELPKRLKVSDSMYLILYSYVY